MKKNQSLVLSLILLTLFIVKVQAKSQVVTVFDYKAAAVEMDKFLGKDSQDKILVFDVDDTLVHIPDCTLKNVPSSVYWKVKIKQCPFFVTEADVVDIIKNYQATGFDTMVLTARGPEFVPTTEKQLDDLGINFYGFPFTSADNFKEKVTSKKYMEFFNALAHVNGTSKGKALKRFQTEWFASPYKKIVFVDDNIKNIRSVDGTFKNDDQTDVLIIHYRKYDD